MIVVPGRTALSAARKAAALAKIRTVAPEVTSVEARWVHLVVSSRELTFEEVEQLGRMLAYGPLDTPTGPPKRLETVETVSFVVTPRIGTVSPWSSKATDIAHVCGLDAITRIERGLEWTLIGEGVDVPKVSALLSDRMTESVVTRESDLAKVVGAGGTPRPLRFIELGDSGVTTLRDASKRMGLALADDEIEYLVARYKELGRDPTDVELMMFAQANSEHCRHKIFNAEFFVAGQKQDHSLFQWIKRTTAAAPAGVLSAYKDNAAVVAGNVAERLFPDADGVYRPHKEPSHILGKVETHNHPTAISPFPGAATGSGGEIRDEGATGRGAKPKAGLVGFTVSDLRIPGALEPWEKAEWLGSPARIATALDIMTEGPLGGAAFNNEFGRPAILGYFRTFELGDRGYHKPVMLAGGIGAIREAHVQKAPVPAGAALVVLGGPAFLIGLGGGAASSLAQGASAEDLDYASVQRDNPEMQRRCQEVIDRCWALGDKNPILSIHDVGAGGLSNALPELVHDAGLGARLELRKIPSGEADLSPLELWSNEAQERYVMAIAPDRIAEFAALCARERAPWAQVGTATPDGRLTLSDERGGPAPVDLPLELVLGKPPRMTRYADPMPSPRRALDLAGASISEALDRVLGLPTVADKSFLVTIGDRTVGGLVARDSMVGPFQVPVADCALTPAGFDTNAGEVMALGERPPVALLDAAAASRLAIGEVITNLASAPVGDLGRIKLSCNWMAAAGHPGEDARLYEAVRAASELCVALEIAVPVGKDSMSMRTQWDGKAIVSPVTLVATGFGPVTDVRLAITPELRGTGELLFIDLTPPGTRPRLGGSCLAQVFGQLGDVPPDLDDPARLSRFFMAMQRLLAERAVLAYHDRSDGGAIVTALEMAFAAGLGLELDLTRLDPEPLRALFSEELGAIVEVLAEHVEHVRRVFAAEGIPVHAIGRAVPGDSITVAHGGHLQIDATRTELRGRWSHVSHQIARRRDDASCADEEQASRIDPHAPGLTTKLEFDPSADIAAPYIARGARPRVAILREQGVNGQIEMAAAFTRAGFDAIDIHMTDLIEGRADLTDCRGAVACGGFSFGDVLGAGRGWAATFRYNARAQTAIRRFADRAETFLLGVCNGCQMLSDLAPDLVASTATTWPRFVRNRSERFEAREVLLRIEKSPSLFFAGMEGSRIPIASSHGEGRAEFADPSHMEALESQHLVAARFVDGTGVVTQRYPANPNGSPRGIASITTPDGRLTVIMPHPERVFRTVQLSWHPPGWGEDSPWMRMFRNARVWVG